MLRLAIECAGEGSEESPLHYQHPEHLAALELVVPFGMLVEVTAHPVCCCDAKRVRFVAERIGELARRRYALHIGREGMNSYSHSTPSGPMLKSKSTMLRSGRKP